MEIVTAFLGTLRMAFATFWENPVGIDLGFFIIRRRSGRGFEIQMSRLLGDDSPKTLSIATALGAASSSCSYAAAALARSIFAKAPISRRQWFSSWPPPILLPNSGYHDHPHGLAVCCGRVRRRTSHGRHSGDAFSRLLDQPDGR
jgi:hypothetical protein